MKDPTLPCPAYHLPGESAELFAGDFDTPTELVFGFSKRIIDTLPGVKQMTIIVHAPGTVLPFHKDEEEELEEHWKIHIPIETNEHSLFQYEDEEFVLAVGHAYLVNTSLTHGTDNQGLTERAHLIFKIPSARVEEILNSEFDI